MIDFVFCLHFYFLTTYNVTLWTKIQTRFENTQNFRLLIMPSIGLTTKFVNLLKIIGKSPQVMKIRQDSVKFGINSFINFCFRRLMLENLSRKFEASNRYNLEEDEPMNQNFVLLWNMRSRKKCKNRQIENIFIQCNRST